MLIACAGPRPTLVVTNRHAADDSSRMGPITALATDDFLGDPETIHRRQGASESPRDHSQRTLQRRSTTARSLSQQDICGVRRLLPRSCGLESEAASPLVTRSHSVHGIRCYCSRCAFSALRDHLFVSHRSHYACGSAAGRHCLSKTWRPANRIATFQHVHRDWCDRLLHARRNPNSRWR